MPRETEIVEVELSDGTVFNAEVAVPGGVSDIGAWDRLHLDQAKESIETITEWAVRSVRGALPEPPDRFGLEFGLKLAVKTGKLTSVLAEAGGEASITVKLEWTGPAHRNDQDG